MTDDAGNDRMADNTNMTHDDDTTTGRRTYRRRKVLAGLGAAGIAGLAGCGSNGENATAEPSSDGGTATETSGSEAVDEAFIEEFRGSGALAQNRDIGGTSIAELPNLSGDLTIYLGGGEGGLYRDLIARFENIYPDFSAQIRASGTADAANTLINEGPATPADVFWSVDAGSLAAVAQRGLTATLPSAVTEPVPLEFHPEDLWVGIAGRARSVPYNTDVLTAEEVPEKVMEFPNADALSGPMGWAPTYGAFQAFVTAMRVLSGEQATREWLNGMQESNVTQYSNEFLVSNAVADGALDAGFANHYYALRVKAARPNAPIDLAFTSDDAGALINAAGAEVMQASQNKQLGFTFIRHLLSAEAQEFFATRTYAYPMVPGVPPVGGLPTIDELNPPSFDLTKLSNLEPTLRLMRETGVL